MGAEPSDVWRCAVKPKSNTIAEGSRFCLPPVQQAITMKVWHVDLKSRGVGNPATSDIKPELGAGRGVGEQEEAPSWKREGLQREAKSWSYREQGSTRY